MLLVGGQLAELVLLALFYAHFKFVHFFDQQFNYHSSFGFSPTNYAICGRGQRFFLAGTSPSIFSSRIFLFVEKDENVYA